MGRLTRDGNAEPVSRDQILRREQGQENINFPCSADHEQDWQPYLVDPYSAIFDVRPSRYRVSLLILHAQAEYSIGKRETHCQTVYRHVDTHQNQNTP